MLRLCLYVSDIVSSFFRARHKRDFFKVQVCNTFSGWCCENENAGLAANYIEIQDVLSVQFPTVW